MSLHGEIYDYPTRILVHSETDSEGSYLVDLCAYPVGGLYNGCCQCRNWLYRCLPQLKKPENSGKIFRCKHIRWARENCLDFILPHMAASDPNTPEEH